METMPAVVVDNPDALVDEIIVIQVVNLDPNQPITIRAEIKEKGKIFAGCGYFTADDSGNVDLTRQPSVGGTYKGISPMGLFWSMKSAPGQPPGIRLIKNNASTPLVVDISVYSGHCDLEQIYSSNQEHLCTRRIHRWYMAKGVQKIRVRSGRLRGTLFLPQGSGPFSGVIDLFGTIGASIEFRAALLASRGFAAMALPYFLYDDLPQNLEDVDLEYFLVWTDIWVRTTNLPQAQLDSFLTAEAVEWLSKQPLVKGDKLGVIGVSKGREIALQMAYYSEKIKAVVSLNGVPFLTGVPMKFNGGYVGQSLRFPKDYIETEEGRCLRRTMDCEIKNYLPLWEKTDVHTLLILGLDDMCVDPKILQTFYGQYPTDEQHLCRLCAYEQAGHLIEPPYAPLTRNAIAYIRGAHESYYQGIIMLLWGGYPEGHARAQEDSWQKILEHFRTHLSKTSVDEINSKL